MPRRPRTTPRGGIVVGMATAGTRGYSATKEQLLKRLRRMEGGGGGGGGMAEDAGYCIDVRPQIPATGAALDKVAPARPDAHARHCVIEGPEAEKDDRTEELMAA